jgi:hypothetical protein
MVCRGRFSRFANQHLACPAFEKFNALAEWPLPGGRTGPRRAIYATSDALSFALARYRDELGTEFELFQPGLDTAMSIVDKGQLLQNVFPRSKAMARLVERIEWQDYRRRRGSQGPTAIVRRWRRTSYARHAASSRLHKAAWVMQ